MLTPICGGDFLSFKRASNDLCNALAAVARRLCTTLVHPDGLSAFVACCLIPLNKNPGVIPIGIGESFLKNYCQSDS